jgi:hypothetical protein
MGGLLSGGGRTGASNLLTILEAARATGSPQPGGGLQGRPTPMGFWEALVRAQSQVNPNATPFSVLLSLMQGKGQTP